MVGASIAGLLAARVLADTYDHVTLVERDDLEGDPGTRRGVPHARQPHALLSRGLSVMQQLYPDVLADFRHAGALTGDMTDASRLALGRDRLTRYKSGLTILFASRALIEQCLRRRTLALPNVTLLDHVRFRGHHLDHARLRVVGIEIERPQQETDVLTADLVVDATGRGSTTPAWLERHWGERPKETRIDIKVTYTSRFYRRLPQHLGGDLGLGSLPQQPQERRTAACTAVEGDRWHFGLAGSLGDHAPPTDAGFLAFARSLNYPDVAEFLATLEPVSDFEVHKYPASVRRHYERMRLPVGLLVIGDALCSFNPTYGQGMTVAALEAQVLSDALEHTTTAEQLQRRYFRNAARVVALPWSMVSGGDGSYPELRQHQTITSRLATRYFNLIQHAMKHDGVVLATFFAVMHMALPPSALFKPTFVLRLLRHRARPHHTSTAPAT